MGFLPTRVPYIFRQMQLEGLVWRIHATRAVEMEGVGHVAEQGTYHNSNVVTAGAVVDAPHVQVLVEPVDYN
jgi:hypothetical protein